MDFAQKTHKGLISDELLIKSAKLVTKQSSNPEVLVGLARYTTHPNIQVRKEIISAILRLEVEKPTTEFCSYLIEAVKQYGELEEKVTIDILSMIQALKLNNQELVITLVTLLQKSDNKANALRYSIINTLVRLDINFPSVISLLSKYLNSENKELVKCTLTLLDKIGKDAGTDSIILQLLKIIEKFSPVGKVVEPTGVRVNEFAARTLENIYKKNDKLSGSVFHQLISNLSNPSYHVVYCTLSVIKYFGTSARNSVIIELVIGKFVNFDTFAADALIALGEDAVAPNITKIIALFRNASTRRAAARVLTRFATLPQLVKYFDVFAQYLLDSDTDVSNLTLDILCASGPNAAVESIANALGKLIFPSMKNPQVLEILRNFDKSFLITTKLIDSLEEVILKGPFNSIRKEAASTFLLVSTSERKMRLLSMIENNLNKDDYIEIQYSLDQINLLGIVLPTMIPRILNLFADDNVALRTVQLLSDIGADILNQSSSLKILLGYLTKKEKPYFLSIKLLESSDEICSALSQELLTLLSKTTSNLVVSILGNMTVFSKDPVHLKELASYMLSERHDLRHAVSKLLLQMAEFSLHPDVLQELRPCLQSTNPLIYEEAKELISQIREFKEKMKEKQQNLDKKVPDLVRPEKKEPPRIKIFDISELEADNSPPSFHGYYSVTLDLLL